MIDAVLSYHDNPLTCGVTKFNHLLAGRLGVPHLLWSTADHCACPLLSVKTSEVTFWPLWEKRWPVFDVFLHDVPAFPALDCINAARTVYAANAAIAERVRSLRADVVTAFCPSTIAGNPTRGAFNVLTFGMAHKAQRPFFDLLKRSLDEQYGADYTVSVSCGIHEGSSWSTAWRETEDLFRGVFGDRARVLGFLADDGLAREIAECSLIALCYDPAVRANNTTYWTAVDSGKPILTVTDEHSPSASDPHSWDALLQIMGVSVPV